MILVNGREAEYVPVHDRGLAYGDGVFETLRVRRGRLPLMEEHLSRLMKGTRALGFAMSDEKRLRDELARVAVHFPEGIIKLVVTRGSGGRGYRPPAEPEPLRILQGMEAPGHVPRWQQDGVSLRTCTTRLSGPPELAGLKHLNRLSQVLARAEWGEEFDEGLMRNLDGELVEGTMSNLFVVRDRTLLTPPVGIGVEGVMRALVLELAAGADLATEVRALADEEIASADEVFITNSVIGICPVRRVDDRHVPVGTIVRELQTVAERELDRRCEN